MRQKKGQQSIGKRRGGILQLPETLGFNQTVYYICGLSRPYRWENNTHFVFKQTTGKERLYAENGLKNEEMFAEYRETNNAETKAQILHTGKLPNGLVVVGNFVAAPKDCFSEKYISDEFPNRELEEYRTCRNWRFAHWAIAHPEFFENEKF